MGRGKLKFKGDDKARKKKSSAKNNHPSHAASGGAVAAKGGVNAGSGGTNTQQQFEGGSSPDIAFGSDRQTKEADETQGQPAVREGQGLITASSTAVLGHGTAFKTQLRAGDAILASGEMRVITMVLSSISLAISSEFSSDLKTPTTFSYINKPRDDKKEKAALSQKARQEKEEVEQRAMGTYGNKGEIIYREKTEHGGYRIKKEQATREMSRSDLLSVRERKKSDKYC